MMITYVAPPLLIFFGVISSNGYQLCAGIMSYILMIFAFRPSVKYFQLSNFWIFTLPLAGVFFTMMTIDSAFKYWQGREGFWKGRYYPPN